MPNPSSPLGTVLATLQDAHRRGELSPPDLEWSVRLLSGHRRRANQRLEALERPEQILRAAATVFRRQGYHRATIEDVAAELSLTKAGVYHYFGSKREVLEAICARAMARADDEVTEGLRQPGGPVVQLRAALEGYAEALMGQDSLAVLVRHFDEQSDSAKRTQLKRRKGIETKIRDKLEEGIQNGLMKAGDTQVAVFVMIGALNWIYSWYEPGGRLPPEAVRDALVSFLMHGVLVRPPD